MARPTGIHRVINFLLVLLVNRTVATETSYYMDELCDGTIDAGSSGGTLDSQDGPSYDNYLDCTVTINADSGRRILLTFDTVDIEDNIFGCDFTDYLRIYDGSSTFDQTLGGYICGNDTPDDIRSTSNFITLRFRTDSSSTGRGFLIAFTSFSDIPCALGEFECDNYRCVDSNLNNNGFDNCGDNSDEYTPTSPGGRHFMDLLCGETIDAGSTGGTLDSQTGSNYANYFDCTVTISADYDRRILLSFVRVDIEGSGYNCQSADYLQIYDGWSSLDVTLGGDICGSDTPNDIVSTTNFITLRFRTDSSETNSGFLIAFTSFSEYSCGSDEFDCDNNRCIDSSLKYNDYDNCGDNSDELDIDTYYGLAVGVIVAIVIGSLIAVVLIAVCIGCIFYHACKSNPPRQNTVVLAQTPQQPAYNQQPPMAMQPVGQPGSYGQPTYGQPAYGQPAPYGQPTPHGQPAPYMQPAPTEQPPPHYEEPTPIAQPAPSEEVKI